MIVRRVQPPPTFELVLDDDEAHYLRCLVGGVGLTRSAPERLKDTLRSLWEGLDEAGVRPQSEETFGDYFVGEVRCKP